jgi:hypothetical protein
MARDDGIMNATAVEMADDRARYEKNQQALLNAAEDRLLVLIHELMSLKFMVDGAVRQQAADGSHAGVDLVPTSETVEKLLTTTEQTISWLHVQWSALPTDESGDQPDRGLH